MSAVHALAVRGRGAMGIPFTKGAVAWSVEQDAQRGELVLVLASANAVVQLRRGEDFSDTALLALVGSGSPMYRDEKHSPRAFAALRESLDGPLEAFERSAEARQVVEDERRREAVSGALLRARAAQERRLAERAARVAEGLPAFDDVAGRELRPRDVAPSSAEAVAGAREALRELAAEEIEDLATPVELVALPAVEWPPGMKVARVGEGLVLAASAETVARSGCTAILLVAGRADGEGLGSRRLLVDVSREVELAAVLDEVAQERGVAWSVLAREFLVGCSEIGLALGRLS